MRQYSILLITLILAVMPLGCISSGGGGGGESNSSSGGGSSPLNLSDVTLLFNLNDMLAKNETSNDIMLAKLLDFITMTETSYAANLYDYVTTLYVKVTANDITRDVSTSITIANPSSPFSVSLTVPNGTNRLFEVKLKDRNDNVLYSGDLTIDVGNTGASQNISINVDVDEGIDADDYVTIGRNHLKSHKLELAYIAFDTAVCLDDDHPIARFFRGFTHLLLLIQKDDTTASAASPNTDIASVLNLYSNLSDIYSSTIAPDIYNENYDQDLDSFYNNSWVEPSSITTDDNVDLVENVFLPELDRIINDLAKAEADTVFYTTLTTDMHFGINSTIKIDRGDIYILEAIAYALKAYYSHGLAYQMRTDSNYWHDEMDKKDNDIANYKGLEYILDNDPGSAGEEILDFTGGAGTYLSRAKTAISNGLDKLKSGLQFIDRRSIPDKEAEDHIFNLVDVDDNVSAGLGLHKNNISKIITNIDEAKSALDGEATYTSYKKYNDTSTTADLIGINLSTQFSTSTAPNRNSRPEFYYHSISRNDIPILDTNNPDSSSAFVDIQTGTVTKLKKSGEVNWKYFNNLEDLLREDMLPDVYKFSVPQKTIAMTGNLADFTGGSPALKPVALDKEETEIPQDRDIIEVYMAKDSTYLYAGLRLRGTPYAGLFASGEYLNYHIGFNCQRYDRGFNSVPVTIELGGSPTGWKWRLFSYGQDKGIISELGATDCALGDIAEFRIPLTYIRDKINQYEPSNDFPSGQWDGKEIFISTSLWSYMSGAYNSDTTHDGKLAQLN